MRAVRYRPRAELDIQSALIYTGEVLGNPLAARALYEALMESIDRIRELPTLGRIFKDERLTGRGYRSLLAGNYRIFYRYDDIEVVIWRVIHVRQDIDDFEFIEW